MYRTLSALILLLLLVSITLAHTSRPQSAPAGDHLAYLPTIRRDVLPMATTNLQVSAATYLGGAAADQITALDIAPDGTIVAGGALPGFNPAGVTPVMLLGGSDGVVVRMASDGRTVQSVTRIGTLINDLEVNQSGQIAACGSFGVALLDPTASAALWSYNPGVGSRCALGDDGTLAALIGGTVYVYSTAGSLLGSWAVGGTSRSDIAIDALSGRVFITGYTQKTSSLQVAWIKAWSYAGALAWTSYDFSAAEISGQALGADTRGERLALGRDGKLYFAGSINGGTGASIFSRDPKTVSAKLSSDRAVATDSYNTPSNVGSIKMIWYGRYSSTTGALEQGSSLLTRLSAGSGNSIGVQAIMADQYGYIFLAGEVSCCLHNRNTRQVASMTVGPYAGNEAYLLTVSPDFRQRLVWTPFAGAGGAANSPATAVSVRGNTAAIGITFKSGALITSNAFQSAPGSTQDGYIAVWRP